MRKLILKGKLSEIVTILHDLRIKGYDKVRSISI